MSNEKEKHGAPTAKKGCSIPSSLRASISPRSSLKKSKRQARPCRRMAPRMKKTGSSRKMPRLQNSKPALRHRRQLPAHWAASPSKASQTS